MGCCRVICLQRGADLHMAQLMPLPLTVSCFSKIQIGCTFLVPAYPGSPGKRAVNRVYVCMHVTTDCFTLHYTVLTFNQFLQVVPDPMSGGRLRPAVESLVPVRAYRGEPCKSQLLGSPGAARSPVILVVKLGGVQLQKRPHQYALQHLQENVV